MQNDQAVIRKMFGCLIYVIHLPIPKTFFQFPKICGAEGWTYLKLVSAIFSLFLKEKCVAQSFLTKYFEQKFNLRLLYLPIVSRRFILSLATTQPAFCKTSCVEKITVCVIETMLVTQPLVQMNKARREVNQQVNLKSR